MKSQGPAYKENRSWLFTAHVTGKNGTQPSFWNNAFFFGRNSKPFLRKFKAVVSQTNNPPAQFVRSWTARAPGHKGESDERRRRISARRVSRKRKNIKGSLGARIVPSLQNYSVANILHSFLDVALMSTRDDKLEGLGKLDQLLIESYRSCHCSENRLPSSKASSTMTNPHRRIFGACGSWAANVIFKLCLDVM